MVSSSALPDRPKPMKTPNPIKSGLSKNPDITIKTPKNIHRVGLFLNPGF